MKWWQFMIWLLSIVGLNAQHKEWTFSADRQISIRFRAPEQPPVFLVSPDIPSFQWQTPMAYNSTDSLWEITLSPLPAGAYRYGIRIGDLTITDPNNPLISQSNRTNWSLFFVQGDSLLDYRPVPHGTIGFRTYYSPVLDTTRRFHIYLPPEFGKTARTYPVLYLIHGAYDSDHAWPSVGMIANILDNLLAEREVVPMIVVMPDAHTGPFDPAVPGLMSRHIREFVRDFLQVLKPLIEKEYPVTGKPEETAIAGLSMGGAETIEIAFTKPGSFGYAGVFSSGIFEFRSENLAASKAAWKSRHIDAFPKTGDKSPFQLVWFATGREDFLLQTSLYTVQFLEENGIPVVWTESDGGHTWINWRNYAVRFLPRLFK